METRHQTEKLTGCRRDYPVSPSVIVRDLVVIGVIRVLPVIRQVEEEEEKLRSDASKA